MNINWEKVRQVAAWLVLAGLTLLLAARVGFEIGNKKARRLPMNPLEEKFALFSKKIPLNPFRLLDKQFREIEQPPRPDGPLIEVGSKRLPIDKNYFYAAPVSPDDPNHRLVLRNLKTNAVVKTWTYQMTGNSPHYLRAPILLPDSSVVTRVVQKPSDESPYHSVLVKIDKDSKVVWTYSDWPTHHSVAADENGDIWTCAHYQPDEEPADSVFRFYVGDAVLKLDGKTGEQLYIKHIVDMFRDNPKYDMSFFGYDIADRFHLNDVEPARFESPYWQRGDIFISLNRPSTILQYRPSTGEIIWLRNTSLGHQHDVDLLNDSILTVFDNRTYYNINYDGALTEKYEVKEPSSKFMWYNFATDSLFPKYTSVFVETGLATPTEGLVDYFPQDGVLYAEAPDLGFFIVSDLKNDTTYRLAFPGESEAYVTNLNWFRMYDTDSIY